MTSPKLKAAAAADEKFSYPIKQMDIKEFNFCPYNDNWKSTRACLPK